MSEKALNLAREQILKSIRRIDPRISPHEAASLSEELLSEIDWENSALMHKSIAWITSHYMQNRVFANT